MAARGAARDVRVEVAPGTLGVKFDPDYNGNAAVVKRYIPLPSGQESPLKKHVQIGYVLVSVNDKNVATMKHKDVLRAMKKELSTVAFPEYPEIAEFRSRAKAMESQWEETLHRLPEKVEALIQICDFRALNLS